MSKIDDNEAYENLGMVPYSARQAGIFANAGSYSGVQRCPLVRTVHAGVEQ